MRYKLCDYYYYYLMPECSIHVLRMVEVQCHEVDIKCDRTFPRLAIGVSNASLLLCSNAVGNCDSDTIRRAQESCYTMSYTRVGGEYSVRKTLEANNTKQFSENTNLC